MRGFAIVLLFALAGCGPADRAADIVTSTRHCRTDLVRPDLMMRLSSYNPVHDSIDVWVVQACHPTLTGCSPVLTYRHALPPAYSIQADGSLLIEVLGGFVMDTPASQVSYDGGRHPVVVRQIKGNVGQQGVDAFKARIGMAPGASSPDLCTP